MGIESGDLPRTRAARLPATERRHQLLGVALKVIREEGADSLTLGNLAARAGVSKPVVYDQFGTRSGLLIALYRWIDTERLDAFQRSMAAEPSGRSQTIARLADAYIRCAADLTGEFHIVGAALAGSPEKARVYDELLDQSVLLFVSILRPFSRLSETTLLRLCTGLVGAGEALSAAIVRGGMAEADAVATFVDIMDATIR